MSCDFCQIKQVELSRLIVCWDIRVVRWFRCAQAFTPCWSEILRQQMVSAAILSSTCVTISSFSTQVSSSDQTNTCFMFRIFVLIPSLVRSRTCHMWFGQGLNGCVIIQPDFIVLSRFIFTFGRCLTVYYLETKPQLSWKIWAIQT